MAALVGDSNNDKQYDNLMKILFGIDVNESFSATPSDMSRGPGIVESRAL